jgi:hypothetical protein
MEKELEMVVCEGTCERLVDKDFLNECPQCGVFYCGRVIVNGKACSCPCFPQPTPTEATDLAMEYLEEIGLPLQPGDTAIVQCEFGAVYGLRGPETFLRKKIGFKENQDGSLESHLPLEFEGKHSRLQRSLKEQARPGAEFAHAEYMTENFAVSIKQFDCLGSPFTVSVFHPFTA